MTARQMKTLGLALFLFVVWLISRGLRLVTHPLTGDRTSKRVQFWTRQIIQLVARQGASLLLLGFTAGALATYGVVRLV